MNTKKIIQDIRILLSLFFLFAFTVTSFAQSEDKNAPRFLYLVTAKTATVHFDVKHENYSIEVKHPDPWVLSFTMLPHRQAQYISLNEFLKKGKTEIQNANKGHLTLGLNTALVAPDTIGNEPVQFVFSISQMTYDTKTRFLHFSVNKLPNAQEETHIKDGYVINHPVFIVDDACISCGVGG